MLELHEMSFFLHDFFLAAMPSSLSHLLIYSGNWSGLASFCNFTLFHTFRAGRNLLPKTWGFALPHLGRSLQARWWRNSVASAISGYSVLELENFWIWCLRLEIHDDHALSQIYASSWTFPSSSIAQENWGPHLCHHWLIFHIYI